MTLAFVSPLFAQAAAVSAGLALALVIYRAGAGQFRWRLFVDAVALGAVMGALIAFLEASLDLRHNPLRFSPATMAFLLAGWPEEAAKLIAIVGFLRPHYLARDARDLTLAGASLALGFAVLENMLYLGNAGANWQQLAFLRAVTAAPLHIMLGIGAGYGVALAGSFPPLWRAALYLAILAALGALHGGYDFAVISLSRGGPPNAFVASLAAAFAVDPQTVLEAAMAATEGVVALLAILALARLPARPRRRSPRVWGRLALSRALGLGLGGALAAASALFLAFAAALGYALDDATPALDIATLATLPLAVGLMLAAFHGGDLEPSPAWRRRLRGAGAALALAASGAAVVWGRAPLHDVVASRLETRGAREAQRSDYEGALRDYDRALGWRPDSAALLVERAAALAALERFDAALADLRRAVALDPLNPAVWARLSALHRQTHDTAGAVFDIDKAVALQPDSPALLALSVQSRLEIGDLARAQADLSRALALAPRDPATLHIAATLAVYQGDYDAALRSLNQSLHDAPSDAIGFARGRVWFYKGDARRALADFTAAERGALGLYPALWRFLASARAKDDDRADLEAQAKADAGASWPAPVAKLLLGQSTFGQTLAAAKDADQRCEADFYWGQWRVEAGDLDEGRRALRAAETECPPGFIEYEGARAALRVMRR